MWPAWSGLMKLASWVNFTIVWTSFQRRVPVNRTLRLWRSFLNELLLVICPLQGFVLRRTGIQFEAGAHWMSGLMHIRPSFEFGESQW